MKTNPTIRKRGITLLEVLLVLGILAIVGGAAAATSRSLQRRTLNNASLALQAHMRHIQQLAVIEGRQYNIYFDLVENRYRTRINVWGAPAEVTYLPRGVTIHSVATATGLSRLHFLPRGTPSTAATITLAHGAYRQRLTVSLSGGRVSVLPIERIP